MLALIALSAVAHIGQPVVARFVENDRRYTAGSIYQRVEISFTNRTNAPLAMRSCTKDVRVEAFTVRKSDWARVDTTSAFGVGSGEGAGWSTRCEDIVLAPGRPTSVAYYVRGPQGRAPRSGYRMTVDTSVGRFVFLEGRAPAV